jgi:hypothetical protein
VLRIKRETLNKISKGKLMTTKTEHNKDSHRHPGKTRQ